MADLSLENLDLNLIGRKRVPLSFNVERPLEVADLQMLGEERAIKAPPIKRLRQRHHMLAQYIARGIPQGEAAVLCSYTDARVSILMGDTSFKELVTFYGKQVEEEFLGLDKKIAHLGEDLVDEIQERLDDTPEDFSIGQLSDLMTKTLDRSGFGPATNQNVNIKVGLADKMAAARKRIDDMRQSDVIEGTATEVLPQ